MEGSGSFIGVLHQNSLVLRLAATETSTHITESGSERSRGTTFLTAPSGNDLDQPFGPGADTWSTICSVSGIWGQFGMSLLDPRSQRSVSDHDNLIPSSWFGNQFRADDEVTLRVTVGTYW